jgi:putative ubiquitin-RnfH superfamily antitoxin RatB of RatAB toxin-antitoxin module
MAEMIPVQVCYATDKVEILIDLEVEQGATIAQAIASSGIHARLPGVAIDDCPVGIFSKKKTPETVLRARDRIEIYRPLIADPKTTRRRRAGMED